MVFIFFSMEQSQKKNLKKKPATLNTVPWYRRSASEEINSETVLKPSLNSERRISFRDRCQIRPEVDRNCQTSFKCVFVITKRFIRVDVSSMRRPRKNS